MPTKKQLSRQLASLDPDQREIWDAFVEGVKNPGKTIVVKRGRDYDNDPMLHPDRASIGKPTGSRAQGNQFYPVTVDGKPAGGWWQVSNKGHFQLMGNAGGYYTFLVIGPDPKPTDAHALLTRTDQHIPMLAKEPEQRAETALPHPVRKWRALDKANKLLAKVRAQEQKGDWAAAAKTQKQWERAKAAHAKIAAEPGPKTAAEVLEPKPAMNLKPREAQNPATPTPRRRGKGGGSNPGRMPKVTQRRG